MRRAPYIWALLAIALAVYFGFRGSDDSIQEPSDEVSVLGGQTMGTTYSIKIADPITSERLGELAQEVTAELQAVNMQMSTYINDSELSRFNQSASTDWFPVSDYTAKVVQTAIDVGQSSEGRFDVTVGPLVDLWGFGPGKKGDVAPTPDQISAMLQGIGVTQIESRLSPPAIRKSLPQIRVDLSAIAKGHGVDRVANLLNRYEVANYFVEIGGEIVTKGSRGAGQAWRIGIEAPVSNQREMQLALEMSNAAMATSGDYRNYFEENGVRYSHTLDPKTGYPIKHNLASVTVVAENCMLADAWATALNVAGPEIAMDLAKRYDLAALLIVRTGDKFEITASSAFESRFPGWKR